MALGLNIGSGGEYLPIVKIDGKSGVITRSSWDGQTRNSEFLTELVCLMDFDTVQTGYVNFGPTGPVKHLAPIGAPFPAKPTEEGFKQAMQIVVKLPKVGCHEILINAAGVLGAFDALHDKVLAAPENKEGKVPVVRLASSTTQKTSMGTRAIPNFEIVGWELRPADLVAHKKGGTAPRPTPQMTNGPAATGSTPLQPKLAIYDEKIAAGGGYDFG